MAYQAPGQCPVCHHELTITKLNCEQCHTSIEGQFEPCEFCRLEKEHIEFMKTFIRCRGNIKDVEREMGISYPTVKSKLNQLIAALGFEDEGETLVAEEVKKEERKRIVDALERGEISAKEASEQLAKLKY